MGCEGQRGRGKALLRAGPGVRGRRRGRRGTLAWKVVPVLVTAVAGQRRAGEMCDSGSGVSPNAGSLVAVTASLGRSSSICWPSARRCCQRGPRSDAVDPPQGSCLGSGPAAKDFKNCRIPFFLALSRSGSLDVSERTQPTARRPDRPEELLT